jgi:hypothetical protein
MPNGKFALFMLPAAQQQQQQQQLQASASEADGRGKRQRKASGKLLESQATSAVLQSLSGAGPGSRHASPAASAAQSGPAARPKAAASDALTQAQKLEVRLAPWTA